MERQIHQLADEMENALRTRRQWGELLDMRLGE